MRNFLTLVVLLVVATSSLFAGTTKADTSALTSVETEAAFFYNADVSNLDTTKSAGRVAYRKAINVAKKRFDEFARKYSSLVTVSGSTARKMNAANKELQARIAELESGKKDADLLIAAFANRGAVAMTSDTTVSEAQRIEAANYLLNPDTYQDSNKKLTKKGSELKKQYLPVGLQSIPTNEEVEKLINK